MRAVSGAALVVAWGLMLWAGVVEGQEAPDGAEGVPGEAAEEGEADAAGANPDDAGEPGSGGEDAGVDEAAQGSGPVPLDEAIKPKAVEAAEPVEEPVEAPLDPAERAWFITALYAMEAGKWRSAREALGRYLERYPKGRYAAAAAELEEMAARLGAAQEADKSGRTELVIFGTAYGGWLGTGLGVIGDLEEGTVALSALGAAGGLGLTLGLTSGGRQITRGQAKLVTSSGDGGTWPGLGRGLGAGAGDEELASAALSAGALSVLTGALLAGPLDPGEGDMSLFTSGGLWGMMFALSSLLIVQPSGFEEEDFLTAMVIGADLGLIGAGFLAREVDMSRGRVWLIDVSGLAGLFGAGIIVGAVADDAPSAVAGSLLLLGAGGGLWLGTLLTEDWDAQGGAQLDLDPPAPFIAPRAREGGQREVIVGVHLLQGRF